MPNHCCNTLFMSEEALPIILKKYIRVDKKEGKIFDFERIIPVGKIHDWYEQRLEKWGTKWVGYDLNIGESNIDFYTAWSPPTPIIKKLAELHKNFTFRLEYYEPGNAFRGVYTAKWGNEGVSVEDTCWNMKKKDFKELGLL